ncbi:MAG: outer membrane lipoprotein carrier protein LolA [Treponema sp.]|jgi:outer membrane lipoprotein-sorting protein|nr:outer membrane lipoprotein carrier protein LolA [Treponema sp.]
MSSQRQIQGKKGLLFILLFFPLMAASGQTSASFQKICAQLSGQPNTVGKFRQIKTLPNMQHNLVSSGTFIISAGNGILWQTEKPFASALAVTGTALIQTAADGSKTVTAAAGNRTFTEISGAIASVFEGNPEKMAAEFNIAFTSNNSSGSTISWTTQLIPKSEELLSFIQKITLTGTAKDTVSKIESVKLQETNGGTVLYEFTAQIFPKKLTNDQRAFFNEEK